jgi:hypothetical protein
MKTDIMGLQFDNITMEEALDAAKVLLQGEHAARVVTPNAEIAYEALHDENMRTLLNSAELMLPDGAGVVLASKILKTPLKQKVAGVDFADGLLGVLETTGQSLYLLGSKEGRPTEEEADWNTLPELIGLDYDQFLRTVLIAQGSFANFLTAKENERYELLEKLIGCEEQYALIAAGIKQQRDLAQQLSDWGADVILGTHPHVVQDAEWKTSVDGRQTFVAYSLGNFLSTQSKPDQLIGAILTLELNKTTNPDGSVHCAVASPQLHPTVTHYDAGKSNVRTYLFQEYTPELAQAHGVRAAYPSFGIEYIQNVLQANINSAFLALA